HIRPQSTSILARLKWENVRAIIEQGRKHDYPQAISCRAGGSNGADSRNGTRWLKRAREVLGGKWKVPRRSMYSERKEEKCHAKNFARCHRCTHGGVSADDSGAGAKALR